MRNYHPRIYPVNYEIIDRYGTDHPATRVLQVHAEARDKCVGKEIEWPQLGNQAIEQSWFSLSRQKVQTLSAFAYEFLSYDLILDGWLEMGLEPTETELGFFDDERAMRLLLEECEDAALEEGNIEILPLITKAREFLDAYRAAILFRFSECDIAWTESGD